MNLCTPGSHPPTSPSPISTLWPQGAPSRALRPSLPLKIYVDLFPPHLSLGLSRKGTDAENILPPPNSFPFCGWFPSQGGGGGQEQGRRRSAGINTSSKSLIWVRNRQSLHSPHPHLTIQRKTQRNHLFDYVILQNPGKKYNIEEIILLLPPHTPLKTHPDSA